MKTFLIMLMFVLCSAQIYAQDKAAASSQREGSSEASCCNSERNSGKGCGAEAPPASSVESTKAKDNAGKQQ